MDRTYDIVLYGATGFTGQRAARYLADNAPPDLRWAIAGRNASKLEALREQLGAKIGCVVADAQDRAALGELARQARVVCTTAGPFALYGDQLVDACVEHGTHYADITGESPWVRTLIDRYHDRAAADGTRIVPFCGFDSIPSDIGAWMMVRHLREEHGEATVEVRAAFRIGGGLNGGTIASALNLAEQGMGRQLADPTLLNPPERRDRTGYDRYDVRVRRDPALGIVGPFVMAPVNMRVVGRSAALFELEGAPYGPGFRYHEYQEHRSRVAGWAMTLGLGMFDLLLRSERGRGIIRRLAPDPGQGPSEAAIEGGRTEARYVAVGESGREARGRLSYPGDPGNKATVLMLCESGLALALDELPARGGVLTPATAMGGVLLRRLRSAGMTLEVDAG